MTASKLENVIATPASIDAVPRKLFQLLEGVNQSNTALILRDSR